MYLKKTLVFFLPLLFQFNFSAAQNFSLAPDFWDEYEPFSIGLEAGYAHHFLGGSARKELQEMRKEFDHNSTEALDLKGQLIPKLAPHFGITVDYQMSYKWALNTGIKYEERGYNFRVLGAAKDPEYQFDHNFEFNEKYRVSSIEVPLSVTFELEDPIFVSAGFIFGFAIKSSSKMKLSTYQEVVINGEISDQLSSGLVNDELDLADSANSSFAGFFIGVDFALSPNFFISTQIQKTGAFANLDYGELSNASVFLALKYRLFEF